MEDRGRVPVSGSTSTTFLLLMIELVLLCILWVLVRIEAAL